MKYLSGAPFYRRLLALPANIKLGWKGLPLANVLAFYEKSSLTAIKSFITLSTGVFCYKLFSSLTLVGKISWSVCPWQVMSNVCG